MVEPAVWIARRVGAIGTRRHEIIGALSRELSSVADANGGDTALGLSSDDLGQLAAAFGFADLAAAFPSRGDVTRLGRIAWFGSALGDIACAEHGRRADDVIEDAALLNVAVALFDTVVDEQPHRLSALTRAANPHVLKDALFGVAPAHVRDRDSHAGIERLASLFVHVAGRAGRRFAGMHLKLASLDAYFRRMFESEVGTNASRAHAKTLPISLIGSLISPAIFPSRLFRALATFLAQYDDWQDLGHDLTDGRANTFVQLVDAKGWPACTYWPRAALAVGAPRKITDRLIEAERSVLATAGPAAQAKVRALIAWLLAPA